MNNSMKRTRWRAVLVAWLVLLVSGSILYATYYGVSRTLGATVTVAELVTLPSDVMGVFNDSEGTTNLTSLDFGKVPPGGWGYWSKSSVTVYVKNYSNTVGPEPVTLYINAYDPDYAYGNVWVNSLWNVASERWEYPSVLPGQIIPVTVNLEVYGGAPAGSNNFTAVIQGRAVTAPDIMLPLSREEAPTPLSK